MSDDSEPMAEAAEKLDSALESSQSAAEDENGGDGSDGADGDGEEGSGLVDSDDEMAALLDRAEGDIDSLLGVLSGEESYGDAKEEIEDLVDVIEETEELLDTVDLSELPEAVELSELPSAIEGEDVPEAIANAEPRRAVDLTQLASLVEFSELWDAVDVRSFMQNKDELEEATADVTDDEDDNGGNGESGDDSGLMDSFDMSGSGDANGGEESILDDGQAKQLAIQSQLRDAVEEFRESALDARDQLKEARDTAQEKVEEKTGGGTGQPSSRNPTAYSTMVSGWKAGGWSSASFSTVPKQTQHSSAPGHYRIYGRRFDEREGNDE
ncbi:hypothetical protein [Halococcus thailandensis]|uniref:Uncharacterized protein n=1 Tax=Halococcus thailandensis JCM 13552 TaxID=1227457 RepID=M0N951_9EURY|nr:hypothetical protein [Halococcus thailandensis]EMA54088.1 hypothetical protein C451_07452 [Halococcus thailandensis JCM 13552]